MGASALTVRGGYASGAPASMTVAGAASICRGEPLKRSGATPAESGLHPRAALVPAGDAAVLQVSAVRALRYHRPALSRFLAFALPLLLILMGLFTFVQEELGLEVDTASLARFGVARDGALPGGLVLGVWVLEALALIALFLLIQGRSGVWPLDGLLAGWIAWIFRGPLLVLTVGTLTRLPRDPWWPLALRWFALYSICGLLVAGVARRVGLERPSGLGGRA